MADFAGGGTDNTKLIPEKMQVGFQQVSVSQRSSVIFFFGNFRAVAFSICENSLLRVAKLRHRRFLGLRFSEIVPGSY